MHVFSKKTIIFFLLGLVCLTLFLSLLKVKQSKSPVEKTGITPAPLAQQQNIALVHIDPDYYTTLIPNTQQTFKATFSKPLSLNDIYINISVQEPKSITIPSENFSESLSEDKKTIYISLKNPIKPVSQYILTIKNSATKNNIATKTYISDVEEPTPIPTNNLTLIPYLPYRTSNFLLEYVQSENVYMFHFLIDSNSSADLVTQFNSAKEDAIKFIQSKGIDPSTLTILWEHS